MSGKPGFQGSKGDKGSVGYPGQISVCVVSLNWFNRTNHCIVITHAVVFRYFLFRVCVCVCCIGQAGRPGERGNPGLPGSAGEPGRDGSPGK